MGNAAVMYATQSSRTIGTRYFYGINYGLFYSDRLWDQIVRLTEGIPVRVHSTCRETGRR